MISAVGLLYLINLKTTKRESVQNSFPMLTKLTLVLKTYNKFRNTYDKHNNKHATTMH